MLSYIEMVKEAIFVAQNSEKLGVCDPVNNIYKVDEIRLSFGSE